MSGEQHLRIGRTECTEDRVDRVEYLGGHTEESSADDSKNVVLTPATAEIEDFWVITASRAIFSIEAPCKP